MTANDVLRLKLPKAEAIKPKTVKVGTRPVIEGKVEDAKASQG